VTLIWTRVDQKLIHGQVTLAWVPHLDINAIVVIDQDTAEDPWAQKMMLLGLPPEVKDTRFTSPELLTEVMEAGELARRRIMAIFKNIADVLEAMEGGFVFDKLNLGNQACQPPDQNVRLADNFFASPKDLGELAGLKKKGLEIIVQSVPRGKAVRWKPPK